MGKIATIVVAVLVAVTASCEIFDDDDDGTVVQMAFETVDAGPLNLIEPGTGVFRTEAEWAQFYCTHDPSAGPTCIPTVFDFEQEMVIGVFWGHGFSGCTNQADSVVAVRRGPTSIEVEVGPLSDLGDCEAIVSPRQFVIVETSALPVSFTGA